MPITSLVRLFRLLNVEIINVEDFNVRMRKFEKKQRNAVFEISVQNFVRSCAHASYIMGYACVELPRGAQRIRRFVVALPDLLIQGAATDGYQKINISNRVTALIMRVAKISGDAISAQVNHVVIEMYVKGGWELPSRLRSNLYKDKTGGGEHKTQGY
ncbi:uncharacterized protein BT62DRAFT_1007833 [Guyanagaster necrorhizus]|uniref:Uncharacterized protein n=1 Tax=Guyanagaster necrorhizus TaxID=856835 RepID=A0A9P7VP51_9AGAR|nr:uncharacterized protein BT62DRAFT_1007833 [Guyanagaster necrorhizus MCA 3950]KAG7444808.1 hypothetical protein BT62DRAFT_1007833 [Guyanagaster necrorhizus MCA 3950]